MTGGADTLKLLHIIASANPTGGGPIEGILRQNAVLEPHQGAREIVTLDPPDAPFLKDFPIKVHALGLGHPSLARLPMSRFGYSPHLTRWLKAHAADYDRIIVNGLWNYASVGAARVLPNLRVPYFVIPHGMMDPWFRAANPTKHLLKQAFWLLFEGRLLSHAEAVLFTTEEEQRLAAGVFWGHDYRGIVSGYGTQAPPAASPEQVAAFRAQAPDLGDRPFLLFLSRIHPKKGCDLLIEAFARCAPDNPELALVIAGPAAEGYKERLLSQAEALGIASRIHWPGMLAGDGKWGAYHSAKAFVLPSHQENFGIVVAEALGCGVPVMITNKVNIWREVQDGGAGIVTDDTVDGIEVGLRRLLSIREAEFCRMRASARAVFERHFDLRGNIQRLLNILATGQA